ncbi:MAG: helix-turn-helix domain-containing protein, partial [Bacteroidales bacterium]
DKVNSNSSYVSYTINNTFGKNFRSFINDYRIKEACRILAEEDMQKYAIESIAIMVGFKSKSAFNTIFKEVTGVTPSFYIKSVSQR